MPEQPPTLRDMIKGAIDSGRTYEQVAKNAIDPETGKPASGAYMNNIVLGKVDRMPRPHSLRAIAAGLGVPYERVLQAAVRQWYAPKEGAASADAERAETLEELRRLRELAEQSIAALEKQEQRPTG